MGNGIIARTNNGPKFKVGDIRLTTLDSINSKWALCNGDPVMGGGGISPELEELIAPNPTNSDSWLWANQDSTSFKCICYDTVNNVYYGSIQTSDRKAINIYKITSSGAELVFTKTNTTSVYSEIVYSPYLESIVIIEWNTTSETILYKVDIDAGSATNFVTINDNNTTITGDYPYSIAPEAHGYYSTSAAACWAMDKFILFTSYPDYNPHIACYNIESNSMTIMKMPLNMQYSDVFDDTGSQVYVYSVDVGAKIAVAESSDYIILNITAKGISNDDSLTEYEWAMMSINKSTGGLSYSSGVDTGGTGIASSTSSGIYTDSYIISPCITCYDYDNNKFILTATVNESGYPMRATCSFNAITNEFQTVATVSVDDYGSNAPTGGYLNILNINNKLYALVSNGYNCYITTSSKDNNEEAVFELANTYPYIEYGVVQLNNVIPMRLELYKGDIPFDRKLILYGSSTLDYNYLENSLDIYGLSGSPVLPLIDEEGYNAFIKIKD